MFSEEDGSSQEMARVTVLADAPPLRVPREVALLAGWWPPWAYRPYDAYRLARTARQIGRAHV